MAARFDNFLLTTNIPDIARKRVMLLHYTGEAVYDTFLTVQHGEGYETAVACLKDHSAPKKNAAYEPHVSRQKRQNPEESLDPFHVRIRNLAVTCEFADIDKGLFHRS